MEVRDIAHKPVIACSPTDSVEHVAQLMRDNNVGSVVVVEDGRLVGIVTDRDLAVRGLAEGVPPEGPAALLMTREVVHVYGSDDLCSTATTMATIGRRRLPVLNAEGSVEGMVAMDDLVAVFADQIGKLAYTLRSEMVRPSPAAGVSAR